MEEDFNGSPIVASLPEIEPKSDIVLSMDLSKDRIEEFLNFDNEFIDRIYEFHKAFSERGIIFEIDMYKNLFSVLPTIDWRDFDVFKAIFRYVFIKNGENIALFDSIFDTIFKHGKFVGKGMMPEEKIESTPFKQDTQGLNSPELENLSKHKNECKNEHKNEHKNGKMQKQERMTRSHNVKNINETTNDSTDDSNKKHEEDPDKFMLNSEEEYLIEKGLQKNGPIMDIYTKHFLQSPKSNPSTQTPIKPSLKFETNNVKQFTKILMEMTDFFSIFTEEMVNLQKSLKTSSVFKDNTKILKQSYDSIKKKYPEYFAELLDSKDFNSNWLNESRAKYKSAFNVFNVKDIENSDISQDTQKEMNHPFVKFFISASPVQLLRSMFQLENILVHNLSSWDRDKHLSNFYSYLYNKEIIDNPSDVKNPNSTPSKKNYQGSPKKGLSDLRTNLDLLKKLGDMGESGGYPSYPEFLINWGELISKVKEFIKATPKFNLPIPLFHDILMKLTYFSEALKIYKIEFNQLQNKLLKYIKQKNISIAEEITSKLSQLWKIPNQDSSNSSYSSGKNPKDYVSLAYQIGEALATKESARYNRHKRGILNYKQLFRKNFKNFNIPVTLTFKKKKIAKPKLVLLCDVSYSMDVYIKFYLKFFYTLERCYSNIETFTFIDEPVRVSEFFKKFDYNKAFQSVMGLEQMNQWRKSDFGHSFEMFFEKYRDLLDKRTIFIIAGDARSNYRDGRTKIFYRLSQRALKTIWLNPEPESKWNSGDSMIDYYKPACDHVIACSEPHDLLKLINVGIFKIRESEQRQIKIPGGTQKFKEYYPKNHHYHDYYDYDNYYGYRNYRSYRRWRW